MTIVPIFVSEEQESVPDKYYLHMVNTEAVGDNFGGKQAVLFLDKPQFGIYEAEVLSETETHVYVNINRSAAKIVRNNLTNVVKHGNYDKESISTAIHSSIEESSEPVQWDRIILEKGNNVALLDIAFLKDNLPRMATLWSYRPNVGNNRNIYEYLFDIINDSKKIVLFTKMSFRMFSSNWRRV